ncbi:MAG: carboxy terminal-processing peptidase [Oligoflexales bacterium]
MAAKKGLLFGFVFAAFSFGGSSAFALNCKEVTKLTDFYLKMHYSFDDFNDQLSERTMENFIKAWDGGKLYFYKSDIEEFRTQFGKKLDDLAEQEKCDAIDFVVNRYSKRFMERQPYIKKEIVAQHDFKADEYMVIDSEKLDYATSVEELNERWRKRIKLQLLNLKASLESVKEAPEKVMKQAQEKLTKRYDLMVKRHNELTKDNVHAGYLNAFSTALDPHSSYMPVDELEDFRIRTRLSLEGIGASLRSEDGFTIVAGLVKGGAAEKGDALKVEDKIISVAQGDGEAVDVIDWDLQEVVKKIRGPRGTVVKLTILRQKSDTTEKLVIPIIREKIQLVEQQASSKVYDVVVDQKTAKESYKIGVITLPSFYIDFEGRHKQLSDYRSSARDTAKEIEKLKNNKVDAIIMDLRSNGGGGLDESVNVAGLFFDKGPVVQAKVQSGRVEVYNDRDDHTSYNGPLLVMINRHSASASEIFAGAIQDYERGLIIGDSHTFGKGTVQNLNDVPGNLGAVKVTVSKFYRPSGGSTQLKGVESDIVLPSIVDELDIGEKYYDYALNYDMIKPVKHEAFNLVKPYLPAMKKQSETRLSQDEKFKEIFAEIKKYKENEAERTRVSLQEKPDDKDDKNKKDKDKKLAGKDEKKPDDAELDEAATVDLKDDPYLQEGLRIAGDYIQLSKGKKLGKINLPELVADKEPAKKAATTAKP